MKPKNNEDLVNVMKDVGTALTEIVDHYFIAGTKVTLVLRHPNQPDPIVLSDDNDLKKVISAIEKTIIQQLNFKR